MDIIDDEPKYRKKKHSSTSKSSNKSKHKHEYIECLFIHNEHPHRVHVAGIPVGVPFKPWFVQLFP